MTGVVIAASTAELVASGAIAIAAAVIGTVLGWKLTEQSASRARAEEREHARKNRVLEREQDAALLLDETLRGLKLPNASKSPEARAALQVALNDVHEARRRTTVLRDEDLEDRILAVDTVLFMALMDEVQGFGADPFVVGRSISNARRSLAAFRREEPLPTSSFPRNEEVWKLAEGHTRGRQWDPLRDWLMERPEPQ